LGHIALEVDGARVAFTDRHDGVSISPYDTANLGFATGDDADAVAEKILSSRQWEQLLRPVVSRWFARPS